MRTSTGSVPTLGRKDLSAAYNESEFASAPQSLESFALSVVIPCFNSAPQLERCLAALAGNRHRVVEYILINDGSTDQFDAVSANSPIPVRVIHMPERRGSAAARNRGARQAKGDAIVFLDADTCVYPDTLSNIAAAFTNNPHLGAVIGAYDDQPLEKNFYSQYRNLLHSYVHRTSSRTASTFWTGCGAIRRDLFLQYGGFNEARHNVDDIEFGGVLARNRVRIDMRPDIQVTHQKRWTFFSVLTTDVLLRGVPWTKLILREARIPNVLNVSYRNRVSVALTALTLTCALLGFARPDAWLPALAGLCSVAWINRSFYRFLRNRRGTAFVIPAVLAHLLHFVVCGFSFALGSLLFAFSRPAAVQSSSEVTNPLSDSV